MDYLNKVKEFAERTRHKIPSIPEEATLQDKKLAIELIFEELHEFSRACNLEQVFDMLCLETQTQEYKIYPTKDTTNKIEQLDSLGDIICSTLYGAVITGHGEALPLALEVITKSNSTKVYNYLDDVQKDVDILASKGVTNVTIEQNNGYYSIKNPKGKVVKGDKFVPVDLREIPYLLYIKEIGKDSKLSLIGKLIKIDKELLLLENSFIQKEIISYVTGLYIFEVGTEEEKKLDSYFRKRVKGEIERNEEIIKKLLK